MTPEARTLWMSRRRPTSKWRLESIAAIGRVLNAASPELLADDVALLKAVDAEYPFGEREMLPYKMWLLERRIFRDACAVPDATPSADEIGVCEVAGDLVQLGRIDEARKLLEEQAPNRLGRRCPACAMPPGCPCIDLTKKPDASTFVRGQTRQDWRDLVVPHHARLVGHRDAGPLFGGSP